MVRAIVLALLLANTIQAIRIPDLKVDSDDLVAVHKFNQVTEDSVKQWVPPAEIMKKAEFGYGLLSMPAEYMKAWDGEPPAEVQAAWSNANNQLTLPSGDEPNQHDLISHLGARMQKLGQQVNYLEIGVSVLKSFHTQANFFKDAILTAWDLEDPNPVVERLWKQKATLATWKTSRKLKPADFINRYTGPNGNILYYVAGSEYEQATWDQYSIHRSGSPNLILSDAAHKGEAVIKEATKLLELGKIKNDGGDKKFAMVWDDCEYRDGPQKNFFDIGPAVKNTVFPMLLKEFKGRQVCYGSFLMLGWAGKNEVKHGTCLFTTLDVSGPHLSASKSWLAESSDVQCLTA